MWASPKEGYRHNKCSHPTSNWPTRDDQRPPVRPWDSNLGGDVKDVRLVSQWCPPSQPTTACPRVLYARKAIRRGVMKCLEFVRNRPFPQQYIFCGYIVNYIFNFLGAPDLESKTNCTSPAFKAQTLFFFFFPWVKYSCLWDVNNQYTTPHTQTHTHTYIYTHHKWI